jgi:hypothetical protein
MPRPCHLDHPPRPRTCRLCFWCAARSDRGAFHRRLWGEPEPGPARQIIATAGGIGDAILVLTAAEGLRQDDPGQPVYYVAKPWTVDWVHLFWPEEWVLTEPLPGAVEFYPHDTHPQQDAERLARPRWEHYARACLTRPRLPDPRPLAPEAVTWAAPYRGRIALVPWSGYRRPGAPDWAPNCRVWLRSHWLALERLLLDRGHRTVILDDVAGRDEGFQGDRVIGESSNRVAALMKESACVVANDSGMAHVAGALGVAVVAICGLTRGEQIFGIYPRARVAQGPLSCTGCHWTGPQWRPACEELCASLQAVQPEDVLRAVEGHLARDRAEPFLAAAADEGWLREELSRRDVPLGHGGLQADRRKTFERAIRHLARRPTPWVVETGCLRGDGDYRAGMSTTLFGQVLSRHGGRLVSLDSSPANVAFARSRTVGLPVEVVLADSREWLRSYVGPPIDLLYLDSADVGTPGFEQCCLEEARLALPHLADGALILIDDTPAMGDGWEGKGALAVPWLLERGWRVIEAGYQVLLGRAEGERLPTIRSAQ